MQDFDFAAIKETKIEPLFEAWLALPEAQRAKMEVDLREIGDMSNEKGVKAIIDEAEFHLSEDGAHEIFVAMLMALPGHHERAMTTFLDHPALWKGATRLYHADTLSHWRKRKNLPKVKAATEPGDIEAFSAAIKGYYQLIEGRAKHCRVEPYRRGDLEYFFAFPEHYAVNLPEWEGDELELQSRHPPFEIVFVWDAKDGRLDRIRARLGWEPGILNGEGGKPKGMRWRTFERLSAEHDGFVGESLAGVAGRLGMLKEWLG